MGLLEEVRAIQRQGKAARCPVSLLMAGLDKKDREDLEALLADRTTHASIIAQVLEGRGHTVTADALRRHRRAPQVCSCKGA